MTYNLKGRWPRIESAIELARSGKVEDAADQLRDYINTENGNLSWGLYHATTWLELLNQVDSPPESFSQCASQALFERLVPDNITKTDPQGRVEWKLIESEMGEAASEFIRNVPQ